MEKWDFSYVEDEAVFQTHCRWKKVNPARSNFRATFWPYYQPDRELYIASAIVLIDLGLTGPLDTLCISGMRDVRVL